MSLHTLIHRNEIYLSEITCERQLSTTGKSLLKLGKLSLNKTIKFIKIRLDQKERQKNITGIDHKSK